MKSFLAKSIETGCDCGCEFLLPLDQLESEFACPTCGETGRLTSEDIAAVRKILSDAEAKVRKALSARGIGSA